MFETTSTLLTFKNYARAKYGTHPLSVMSKEEVEIFSLLNHLSSESIFL